MKGLRDFGAPGRRDYGRRPGLPSDEHTRLNALERENRELRRAKEILRKALSLFAERSSSAAGSQDSFIDAHRDDCGVESICTQLPIPPTY